MFVDKSIFYLKHNSVSALNNISKLFLIDQKHMDFQFSFF